MFWFCAPKLYNSIYEETQTRQQIPRIYNNEGIGRGVRVDSERSTARAVPYSHALGAYYAYQFLHDPWDSGGN